jgi:hypothetical protein
MKDLAALVLLILLPTVAMAGHELGNGTDNPDPSEDSAWFIAQASDPNRTFTYCLEISPDFGAQEKDIQQSIDTSMSVWTDYIQKKSINDRFTALGHRIVSQGTLQATCDGTQDLTFYFGATNDEIKIQKTKYANPTAFVYRESFSPKTSWAKGFVWVASAGTIDPSRPFPDWKRTASLTGILLHEFGHILGCGHVSGTIMDADLSSLIATYDIHDENLLKIDYSKELTLSTNGAQYDGSFGDDDSDAFQNFFARSPVGYVRARLVTSPSGDLIHVTDDRGTLDLKLNFSANSRTDFPWATDLFKGVFFDQIIGLTVHVIGRPNQAYAQYGSAQTTSHKQVTIIKEVNAAKPSDEGYGVPLSGPINLKYMKDGQLKTLFKSKTL